MAKTAHGRNGGSGVSWRIIGWGSAALLLLLPWLTNAPWTPSDYAIMAALLGGVGLAFEFILRASGSIAYRAGAALALVAAFLTIWVNGAVGMIGSEDNPYNFLFLGVMLVALIGAILCRLRPAGMMRAVLAAAGAQAAFGAFGVPADLRGGMLSIGFAGLWLIAAALFWNASRDSAAETAQ